MVDLAWRKEGNYSAPKEKIPFGATTNKMRKSVVGYRKVGAIYWLVSVSGE